MRLSIILPVLNEAGVIRETLSRLEPLAPGVECIVVDGGSCDGTADLARRWLDGRARVLTGPKGRARQLNQGAREASGDWLLFLHADTILPQDYLQAITMAERGGYAVGAFRLRIRGRHPLLPLLEWGANLRTRFRGIALGDQAPFMRREFFEQRGSFPDLPLMEDYAYFKALRRDGIPVMLAPYAVETSGRRWDRSGFWRTWWQMRRFYWGFDRGRDPAELVARYRDIR